MKMTHSDKLFEIVDNILFITFFHYFSDYSLRPPATMILPLITPTAASPRLVGIGSPDDHSSVNKQVSGITEWTNISTEYLNKLKNFTYLTSVNSNFNL